MSAISQSLVPRHFGDPLNLAMRVLRSGGSHGRFAIWTTALGVAAVPLDLALQAAERRKLAASRGPTRPLLFVCGPPRSGTTVVSQTLIRWLDIAYVNNLMSVFPRSPLTAASLFGHAAPRNHQVASVSHYGKTRSFHGPSDGLYLWDRWLGNDRRRAAGALDADTRSDMRRFFGAFETLVDRPILNKNNSLNVQAAIVGEALPEAHFICMSRDPAYLAQSLLVARRYIHDDVNQPYGVHHPDRNTDDPIDDVCRQVRYYDTAARQQRERLGNDRFWIVDYEDFCRRPWELVERAATILEQSVDGDAIRKELAPLRINNTRTLPDVEFEQLARQLGTTNITNGGNAC